MMNTVQRTAVLYEYEVVGDAAFCLAGRGNKNKYYSIDDEPNVNYTLRRIEYCLQRASQNAN